MDIDLEEAAAASKELIKRFEDILKGLRLQEEQIELGPSSTTYPPNVSATILGVSNPPTTMESSLRDLLALGTNAWNILKVHDEAGTLSNTGGCGTKKMTKKTLYGLDRYL